MRYGRLNPVIRSYSGCVDEEISKCKYIHILEVLPKYSLQEDFKNTYVHTMVLVQLDIEFIKKFKGVKYIEIAFPNQNTLDQLEGDYKIKIPLGVYNDPRIYCVADYSYAKSYPNITRAILDSNTALTYTPNNNIREIELYGSGIRLESYDKIFSIHYKKVTLDCTYTNIDTSKILDMISADEIHLIHNDITQEHVKILLEKPVKSLTLASETEIFCLPTVEKLLNDNYNILSFLYNDYLMPMEIYYRNKSIYKQGINRVKSARKI